MLFLGLENTDASSVLSNSLFGEMATINNAISFSSCKEPVEPLTLEEIADRCHCEEDVCSLSLSFFNFSLFTHAT